MTCQFSSGSSWGFLSPIYQCYVPGPTYLTITDRSNRDITPSLNPSVRAFWVQSAILHYFPRGLENSFPNLEGIAIGSSKLKEIRQEDLKPFPNLKYLNLYTNEIQVVEKDLFKFNPQLKLICFTTNKISHLDPNVFDHLVSQLTYLSLSGNTCTLGDAHDNPKINALIQTLKTGSCKNDAKLAEFEIDGPTTTTTEKIATTTEELTTTSNNCDAEITELKQMIKELTKKFADQKKQLRNVKEELTEVKTKVQTLTEQISECNTGLNNLTSLDLGERLSYVESEVQIRPGDYKRAKRP